MSVLVMYLHLYISVSFYISFASSTLVMGIYIHDTYLQKLSKRFKKNVSRRFFLLAEKCTQKW